MEIRNLRFDFSVPRYWHPRGRAVSILYDNLSVFFPLGERFFIKSIKAHAHLITRPELEQDVKAFCAQEAVHSREHERYNAMLRKLGRPVDDYERRVDRILTRASRYLPKRWQLAATVALEHFTATMGHCVLSDERVLGGAHEEMRSLWRWHSIEENEHKSVAYDVYLVAGGNRIERSLVMLCATVIFWFKVFEQQARMMHSDGIAFELSEWRSLLVYLFDDPGTMKDIFALYAPFFAADFHPAKFDNEALIERATKAQWDAA